MTTDDDPKKKDDAPETPPPVQGAESAATDESLPAEPVFTQTELDERIEAATAETRERHLRVVAEYDNYRKRVQREREMWAAESIERFVTDLLPVLDNFDRALASPAGEKNALVEGVRLTEKQLRAVLATHGVECIDPVGAAFDPRFHEAIQRVPAGDRVPGTVAAVFEKGYTLKGRLVRPARVQVAGDN